MSSAWNSSYDIVRRGNPFFTGSQDKSGNTGNWLFRPSTTKERGQVTRDNLYESVTEITRSSSAGPSSPASKVRYVPRPSELRELNFFSPTSM